MLNEKELSTKFTSAIISGNIAEVSSIVSDYANIEFFFRNNQFFIGLSYRHQQLGVAEILIKNGAVFDVRLLFAINSFSCDQLNYINKIKLYISQIQYDAAVNLVNTYACKNNLKNMILLNTDASIRIEHYLNKHTVTNIKQSHILEYYTNLKNRSSLLTMEVIKGVIGLSYNVNSPFILMPVGTNNYFDAANIIRENQHGLIYLPINGNNKEEYSYTLHEFTHYLLNKLPGFTGCAYFDDTSKKNYEEAAKATLLNVFKIFNITIENYHEIVSSELFSVKFVISFLVNNTDINLFTYLHNTDNAAIKNLALKQYISNDTIPDFSRDRLLGNYLQSYMKKNNISEDKAYLLARIGEFVKRPDDQLCKELIVRLPELEIYGLNAKTLEVFNPLRDYWKKYISPKIQEIIKTLPVPFFDEIQSYEVTSSSDVTAQKRTT